MNECNHCFTACLKEEDVKTMSTCIKLDRDCADICSLTSSLISRGSEHGKHLLKECAEVCNKCAEECDKHVSMGMEHCKICAEACRACASVCRMA